MEEATPVISNVVMRVRGKLVPVQRVDDAHYSIYRNVRSVRIVRRTLPGYQSSSTGGSLRPVEPYVPTLRRRANDRRVKRPPVPIVVRARTETEVWCDEEVYPDAPYVLIVRGKLVARYTSVTAARYYMAEVWPS